MLERLSPAARRAVDLAVVEAAGLGHGHVGTEHLLLGLLASGEGAANPVLAAAGVTVGACREKVAEAVVAAPGPARPPGDLTDRARRALERASRLSLRRGHPDIGTAAVMLSVLDVEGTAGQVLRGIGVDPAPLRQALDGVGRDPDPGAAAPAAKETPAAPAAAGAPDTAAGGAPAEAPGGDSDEGPLCPHCGAPLGEALTWALVSAQSPATERRDYAVAYCGECRTSLNVSPA